MRGFILFLFTISNISYSQVNIDSLITSYSDQIGGKEEWNKIRSFKLKMIGKTGNTRIVSDHYMLKPHNYKIVFNFNEGQRILSYNGKTGQIANKGKIENMPEDMQLEMREESDFFDELMFYKEKGYKPVLCKDMLINNKKYYKISLYKNEKDTQYYYINKSNDLVEIIEEYSEEKKWAGVLFKTVFTGYQKIDNVYFPKSMTIYGNDELFVTYEIIDVKLNFKLETKDFVLE